MTYTNNSIVINILLEASVANTWNAWTDPTVISKWFGSDPAGTVLSAQLDVRKGGNFEITFLDSDQTPHTCFGVYSEVQEFEKLSFTWTWKSEPGVESFVSISLTSEGKFTRMHFEHGNVGAASKHNYVNGWKVTFSKLEKVLKKVDLND